MREKYFEDLGLDNGEQIFEKFKINAFDILNKQNKDKEIQESDEEKDNEKANQ